MISMFKRSTSPDPDLLSAYSSKVPRSAHFESDRDRDGYWVIRITAIDDEKLGDDTLLISQTKHQSDILRQVNDLLMTHREIPNELRDYYESRITLQGDIRGEKVLAGA
jgi:hypothetical protein